jgi:hypothetical protein
MAEKDRSLSRGRDAFVSASRHLIGVLLTSPTPIQQSTGRGGLGNIRQASLSRDARPDSGPDDFSTTRGREPVQGVHKEVC